MNESDVVEWLHGQLRERLGGDETMGELEALVDACTREVRRLLLERLTGDSAAAAEFGCHTCGRMLKVVSHGRPRTVDSSVGTVRFVRSYGWCSHCCRRVYPADVALGLHGHARSSPRVQEICALGVLHAPAGRIEEDVQRMAGVELSASTLHREARRQGERARALRDRDVELSGRPAGVDALAARAPRLPANSTLIVEVDAWNIRERDCWGQTERLRSAGEEPGRWHWVYTGTVFHLAQRIADGKSRSVVTERGYVATRQGLDTFGRQLYAEALQRGLRQAETVLVLGDGAVWIWNLAEKRFKGATQRLDLYHVKEHLWSLAAELHGRGTPEAEQWIRPYMAWLERRKKGALDLIDSLEELHRKLAGIQRSKQDAVAREIGYLKEHKNRMDYKQAKASGQPCGSGAIESTCSQYQRRFKLTGQFWSLAGDEALLALATLHRNGRWDALFPHGQARKSKHRPDERRSPLQN